MEDTVAVTVESVVSQLVLRKWKWKWLVSILQSGVILTFLFTVHVSAVANPGPIVSSDWYRRDLWMFRLFLGFFGISVWGMCSWLVYILLVNTVRHCDVTGELRFVCFNLRVILWVHFECIPAPTNNSSYIGRVISFYFVFVFVFCVFLLGQFVVGHVILACFLWYAVFGSISQSIKIFIVA